MMILVVNVAAKQVINLPIYSRKIFMFVRHIKNI